MTFGEWSWRPNARSGFGSLAMTPFSIRSNRKAGTYRSSGLTTESGRVNRSARLSTSIHPTVAPAFSHAATTSGGSGSGAFFGFGGAGGRTARAPAAATCGPPGRAGSPPGPAAHTTPAAIAPHATRTAAPRWSLRTIRDRTASFASSTTGFATAGAAAARERNRRPRRPAGERRGHRPGGQRTHPGRRDRQPAAGQPPAEPLLGPGQPPGHRPGRPPEPAGRVRLGQPVEEAQQDRGAVLVRQPVELRVQDGHRLRVGPGGLRGGDTVQVGVGGERPVGAAAGGVAGGPAGDPVEPPGDGAPAAGGVGLAGQGEEGGLAGVLGRVVVRQDRPAGAQDHPGVPPDEQFEGGLVPVAVEPGEQVGVRGAVGVGAAAARRQSRTVAGRGFIGNTPGGSYPYSVADGGRAYTFSRRGRARRWRSAGYARSETTRSRLCRRDG